VTGILSIGRRLPIADPSTRELEGSNLMGIGAKKLKLLIILGSGVLISGGLIKRRMKMTTSGRRGNGARPA
jgi:hypothetical protein